MKTNAGKSNRIFAQEMAGLMLSPQFRNWSLGFAMNGSTFSHPGSCEGFRAIVVGHTDKGQGVIMITNAENGDNLMREILNSMAKIYDWRNFSPREREMYALSPAVYKKYSGIYEMTRMFISKYGMRTIH